ncbi:SLAC1 family transporter [Nocardioides sp. GXZ039]|uniref:SLAC1 family transporter n=1 Tax=Nocardioides sp. GXZ039 TaxID=3136018 RepID=UPI0030F4729D
MATSLRAPIATRPLPAGADRVFGPNWFAAVMGTGILATILDVRVLWVLAAVLLGGLLVATAVHRRSYLDHPVQRHFYGAPAMALMTVGSGALAIFGASPLVLWFDALLWTAGTALGVATAFAIPARAAGSALPEVGPWWLMPVVPPTVSATTGALLAPYLPAGLARTCFITLCYGLLILSVVGTVRVLRHLCCRVSRHGFGAPAMAPTWLIVLGPLGQSVTALHHLGLLSGLAPLTPYAGTPVLLAALGWLGVAGVVVLRARPPFGLTWWSFTFPVATVVTGTAALGWGPVAAALTVLLVCAWLVAALGTVRGAWNGSLLRV